MTERNGLGHRPAFVLFSMDMRRRLARADFFVLACALGLLALGLIFIACATRSTPDPAGPAGSESGSAGFLARQAVFLALGAVAFLALQRVSYVALLPYVPLAYLAGLLTLCAVFFTRPVNGAHAWFDLYVFKLQPSELMKPVLILTLAYYLMYRENYRRLAGLAVPLVLCFVPMALILKEPDLGTAMVLAPVVFAMLYAAGARFWHLALMALAGAGGLAGMWFTVMKDYQKRRVLAWLNPGEYRMNEAWQLLQSEVAIGSGGFLGHAGAAGYRRLPERHTDFIFAVAAEEGGFVMAALIVVLAFLLALAALNIASRTREPAGRLIAVGIAVLLSAQALVNAGVALGMLPTTGLTFPLLSYGGSSLLSSCCCLGLLANVGAYREPVLAREAFTGQEERGRTMETRLVTP